MTQGEELGLQESVFPNAVTTVHSVSAASRQPGQWFVLWDAGLVEGGVATALGPSWPQQGHGYLGEDWPSPRLAPGSFWASGFPPLDIK